MLMYSINSITKLASQGSQKHLFLSSTKFLIICWDIHFDAWYLLHQSWIKVEKVIPEQHKTKQCFPEQHNIKQNTRFNNLITIGAHEHQLFNELRWHVVPCQIFICFQS
jgi:hypothetical protein